MRKALLAALLPLALAGCQDNSEVDNLRSQLAKTKQELAEAREESRNDKSELQSRIARLESRLGKSSTESGQPTLREELDALKAELKQAKDPEQQAALEKRIAAVEGRVDKVKDEAVEEARKNLPASSTAAMDEDKIAELAAKKIADAQPTKDFNQAINRLNVSEAEKQAVKDEIIKSKKEMLELLEVPTTDGRRFGEEIIDIFIKGAATGEKQDGAFMNVLADLNNTKVPGDSQGRTYFQMIEDIKKRNRESVGRILKPEDQSKLDAAHKDWTDFDGIEGDPFTDLYLQRLKKYQEENKK
ncbi:MAG: hypothetical protein KBG84_14100 [Planctomycetes bacterium]|nr:hypothetical protein [Planctomycetota bacterium]